MAAVSTKLPLKSKEFLPPRRQERQGYYKKTFTVEVAEMSRT